MSSAKSSSAAPHPPGETGPQVRVAAVQMVSGTRIEANLEEAARLIAAAAAEGAKLVVLPEYFCLMGQRDRDKVAAREEDGQGPIQSFLAEAARRHGIWLIGGTLPLRTPQPERVYNATLVFDPAGARAARYDKIHLFAFRQGDESYDEARTIAPGSEAVTVGCRIGAVELKVGLTVCYDLRFPELYRRLAGADLVVVPSAFTATTGKAHWETLLRARAIENLCYVLAAAQGGKHENGRATFGHSMLVDPWGEIVSRKESGPGIVVGDIFPARIAQCRASLPALDHRILS
jgi:deaminated glutathione amidase